MTIVAPIPVLGEVRISDARRAIGPSLVTLRELTVAVVAPDSTVAVARVKITEKPAGRGDHLAFECPRCGKPKLKLRSHPDGGLACGPCVGHMSDRQRNHRTEQWRFMGPAFNVLLRLLSRPTDNIVQLQRAVDVSERIADEDAFQVKAAVAAADAALDLMAEAQRMKRHVRPRAIARRSSP